MKAFFRTLLACMVAIILVFVLFFIMLAGIAAGSRSEVVLKDNSVLVVELKPDMNEQPLTNPMAGVPFISDRFKPPVSLKEVLDNIHSAKTDDHIKGMFLKMDIFQPGLATLE